MSLTILLAFGGLGGVVVALVQTIRLTNAKAKVEALKLELDAAQKAVAQASSDRTDKDKRYEAIIVALKVEIARLEDASRLATSQDPRVIRERLRRILAGGVTVLVLCVLPGCRHIEYVPAVVDRPCLLEAPPVAKPVALAGPAEGCPDQWVGCLDGPAAISLEANLAAARRWATEAWLRCGPTPETPK